MIIPEGQKAVAKSNPLEVTKSKRTAMVKKAKELMDGKAVDPKVLMDALEQYYVFEKNEHYTSAQLKDVVDQVQADLAPKEEINPE